MQDDDIVIIQLLSVVAVVIGIAIVAVIAGNLVNEILEPLPAVNGPFGAVVSLLVFVYLVGKGASLIL